jgi:hypothetical protein
MAPFNSVPAAIYEELRSIAGAEFVFESFPAQLRRVYLARGRNRWAKMVATDYQPMRLKKWLEREKQQYLKENPNVKKFKLHNLRGTAMSQAKEAGIHFEDAAIAFGCNPNTMRKHYLAFDEVAVTDRVMDAIQGNGNGVEKGNGEAQPKGKSASESDQKGRNGDHRGKKGTEKDGGESGEN